MIGHLTQFLGKFLKIKIPLPTSINTIANNSTLFSEIAKISALYPYSSVKKFSQFMKPMTANPTNKYNYLNPTIYNKSFGSVLPSVFTNKENTFPTKTYSQCTNAKPVEVSDSNYFSEDSMNDDFDEYEESLLDLKDEFYCEHPSKNGGIYLSKGIKIILPPKMMQLPFVRFDYKENNIPDDIRIVHYGNSLLKVPDK